MGILAEAKGEAGYKSSLNASARALALGLVDPAQFYSMMLSTVTRGLTQAWYEGAKECGISQGELTTAELVKMQEMIMANLERIYPLATYIEQVRDPKSRVALNAAIRSRLELWVNAYDRIRVQAKAMACADKKAVWQLGFVKTQHCRSCLAFAGRVYRYSVWEANGALPKSQDLCCRGFRCACSLEDTDQRITPGPFPKSALCK